MTALTEEQVMVDRVTIQYNSLFVRFYVLMTGLAFGLGGAFMLGGADRFSGPSFRGLTNLVAWTGAPPHMIWAALFGTYGLVLVGQMGKLRAIHTLRAGIAIYLFLVLGFAYAAVIDGVAALSGIVAYGVFAIAHAYLSDHLAARGWEG